MVYSKAPGRVNIIGEHTDYNDGLVLPFAIDRYVEVTLEKNEFFYIESENLGKKVEIKNLEKTDSWADYVLGVVWALKESGIKIKPFRMYIKSNLPSGAGLSSSAALEVATIKALTEFYDLKISPLDMVKLTHKAENEFVGVKCGMMDQFTAVFAKKNHAILIDMLTLKYEYVPLKTKEAQFYIIDSNVKHELASSEYNQRRKECAEILKKLNKKTFRDIDIDDLNKLEGTLLKRAKHVLSENERVKKAVKALMNENTKELGNLLTSSHYSLKDMYEVSCEETDFIVDFLTKRDGVYGARMVGGGFGGGVIVLAEKEAFKKAVKLLEKEYKNEYNLQLSWMELKSADGVIENL